MDSAIQANHRVKMKKKQEDIQMFRPFQITIKKKT